MSYLSKIKNGAIQGWITHKILPSITGAQAVLESGSGTSSLSKAPYNNQFGIKAGTDWEGRRTPPLLTREWIGGRWIEVYEEFRAYDSINDSLVDHAAFFTNTPWRTENYKAVVNEKDYIRACWALQNAPSPYATDPGYATKLIRIIESNQLQEWDKAVLSGGTGQGNVIPTPSNVITSVSKTVGGALTSTARQYVKSSSATVIGDSLGVGTRTPLSQLIPLANFNVLGSRQLSSGVSPDGLTTLQSMKTSGTLKDIVVIILGTNAGVTKDQIAQVMNITGERKVLFVDTASEVAHRDKVTSEYISASKSYPNAFHVDWNSHAQPLMADYYSEDGANNEYVHMTPQGYKKHAEYIAEAVYEVQTGNFDVRKASNVLSEFHDIKDIELTQDGVIKYSIFNEQGTEIEVVEQTDILGLESPKGDSAIYNPIAQDQWGMNDGLIKSQWIESLYENSSEKDARILLMESSKELLERAEPSAQYRVSLMDIPDTMSIGDTGIYIDHEFNPPLYIQARVLELTTSFTNPSNNSVVIGNVIELYPQDNSELEALRNELINSRTEIKRELLGSEPIFAEVTSSNGNVLGDRYQETTLTAGLKQGTRDMTIGNKRVVWQRVSTDTAADDIYNTMLESDTKSTLTVVSKDIVGGHSRFVARFYNDTDQFIQQAEIVIRKVDTALWTDTETVPSDARNGATWIDGSGKQWVLKDGVWEERVDQEVISQVRVEVEDVMVEAERLITEQDVIWQGKMEDYDEQVALIDASATDAQTKAEQALIDVGISTDLAQTAKDLADTAKANASQAISDASQAISDASQAKTDAQTAINNAQSALADADNAKTTVNTLSITVNDLEGEVELKASQTEVDSINGTVSNHATTISQNATAIASKAESSLVNTIKGIVDTHTTEISQNATDITSKASSTSVNTLTGRVSTAETAISQNATAITSKASQTEVDTIKGTVSSHTSTLSQQATQISARLTSTQVNSLVDGKGFATQTWANTQITATANGIEQLITQVKTNPTGTITGYNSLKNNVDSMVQAIGTDGGKIAQMVMTNALFKTSVLDKIANTQSSVSQLAGSWALTLKSGGDIKTQINATTDGIRLQSKLIHLSGDTLIDNATIKSAHIKDLDVDKITGNLGEFINISLKAQNSQASLSGSSFKIESIANNQSYIEMSNVPEIRARSANSSMVVMGQGLTNYSVDNAERFFMGTKINGTQHGIMIRKNQGWAIMRESDSFGGTPAKYYTVKYGQQRVAVTEALMADPTVTEVPTGNETQFIINSNYLGRLNGYTNSTSSTIAAPWPYLTTGDLIKYAEGTPGNESGSQSIFKIWTANNTSVSAFDAHVTFNAGYSGSSDRRIKHNVQDTSVEALNHINSLKFKEFKYNSDNRYEPLGIIAQDSGILRIKGEKMESIDIQRSIMLGLKGVQELHEKVKEQAEEIKQLKEFINQ